MPIPVNGAQIRSHNLQISRKKSCMFPVRKKCIAQKIRSVGRKFFFNFFFRFRRAYESPWLTKTINRIIWVRWIDLYGIRFAIKCFYSKSNLQKNPKFWVAILTKKIVTFLAKKMAGRSANRKADRVSSFKNSSSFGAISTMYLDKRQVRERLRLRFSLLIANALLNVLRH